MPKTKRIPLEIGGWIEVIPLRKYARVRFDIINSKYEVKDDFPDKVLQVFIKYEKPKGYKNFIIAKTYGAFKIPLIHAESFAEDLKKLLEDTNNLKLNEFYQMLEKIKNAKNKMAPEKA